MEEAISSILQAAVRAPSGGNSQPWQFRIVGNEIEIIGLAERDHPILNFRNRGTLVAHGALLENIVIATPKFGYQAKIELFPRGNASEVIANVILTQTPPNEDPLYKSIFQRTTNRKPYKKKMPGFGYEEKFRDAIGSFNSVQVKFVTDPVQLETLGKALSVSEIVMFENRLLHKLFFSELVWTNKEESRKKSGLYLKTMELNLSQQKALRMFKFWPITNFFNKFGFARSIAVSNAKMYAATSVMCGIIIEPQDINFLSAGRIMERLWLQATKMGLSGHLITGVPFFWQRIMASEFPDLAPRHKAEIKDAYQTLASVFQVGNDRLVSMVLRIGESDPPSARSSRLSPVVAMR